MFLAQNWGQIGSKFSVLHSSVHLYTKRPEFFSPKKVHFENTFGACTSEVNIESKVVARHLGGKKDE